MAFLELPFHRAATKASEIWGLKTLYFDVGDFRTIEATLEVYSAWGSMVAPPSLTVSVLHSADLNEWYGLGGFANVNPPIPPPPTYMEKIHLTDFLRYVRAEIYIVDVQPEELAIFTFAVLGIARDKRGNA